MTRAAADAYSQGFWDGVETGFAAGYRASMEAEGYAKTEAARLVKDLNLGWSADE